MNVHVKQSESKREREREKKELSTKNSSGLLNDIPSSASYKKTIYISRCVLLYSGLLLDISIDNCHIKFGREQTQPNHDRRPPPLPFGVYKSMEAIPSGLMQHIVSNAIFIDI